MKHRFLKIIGILSVVMLALAMVGCSAGTSDLAYDSEFKESEMDKSESYDGGYNGLGTTPAEAPSVGTSSPTVPGYGGRKVILSAGFTVETREFSDYIVRLKALIGQFGGYTESESQNGTEPYRSLKLTVRVPQENFLEFLNKASENMTVASSWQKSDDVTTEYFDTEAWIEVYTEQRERILELIDQANTIEELIQLEKELTRINYEIEQLTTTLRQYDSLISYSTVTIDIFELAPAEAASTGETLGSKLSLGFKQSLENTGKFFEGLLYVLVVLSPALVIIGVIVAIIIIIVHFAKKRKKARLQPPNSTQQ